MSEVDIALKYANRLIEEFDKFLADELEAYFADQENELHESFPRVLKVLEESEFGALNA